MAHKQPMQGLRRGRPFSSGSATGVVLDRGDDRLRFAGFTAAGQADIAALSGKVQRHVAAHLRTQSNFGLAIMLRLQPGLYSTS